MATRPVNRIKHVVDANVVLAKDTQFPQFLINAKDAPVITSTNQVVTGSKVYGVYLKVICQSNIVATAGLVPNVYLTVLKNPGGNLTFPNGNVVGADDNKKYVIHQEMVMIENTGKGGNPTTIFNGVIKIPKGYSRFGPSDNLTAQVFSPQMDIVVCFQCHYKEFR